MKRLLRVFGWIIFVGVLAVAGAILYSTLSGHTDWYFRVNGEVTVDAHKTTGYMHANTERTILLLTRTDGDRPETYLVSLGRLFPNDEKAVVDCGDWSPVRFLPVPVSHANPCTTLTVDPAKVRDPAIATTLVRRAKSVEFSTASGKKVKGEW